MKKYIIIFIFIFFINITSINAYYEAPVDITKMNIVQLQEAVDNGYLTYETLVRLYLDRINTYDKKYNSIININKKAIEEAKEKDIEYKKNGRKSLLFGIPIVVKDNIDVFGMPTTVGTKSLANSYPKSDSDVIKLLKDKGVIVIAKTNMSEFAFMASSSISSYGSVKNAYNTSYTSYGSSGGTATSVAAQFATIGLGTDTNASIRMPSSGAGLAGFRTTFGLTSTRGIVAYDITRDVVGPITRNVIDNAIVLDAIDGKNINYYDSLLNSSLENKTIGILRELSYGDNIGITSIGGMNTEVKDIFEKTISILKNNSAKIVNIDNWYNQTYYNTYNSTIGGWTMCSAFNKYITNTTGTIRNFNQLVNSYGHIYSISGYTPFCNANTSNVINKYNNIKKNYYDSYNNLFDKYDLDVIIYPTSLEKTSSTRMKSTIALVSPVLGVPSLTINMGYDKDNQPYGLEIMGLKNKEEDIYNIAYSYEKITNNYKLPSISPNLYIVPKNVIKLQKLYKDNKNLIFNGIFSSKKKTTYNKTLEDIKSFFLNYNSYKDKSDYAEDLTTRLNKSIKDNKTNNMYLMLLIILIPIIFINKKHKRRKKFTRR
ncbi:MAG TPA: amidase [Bacilli bacterium]|nr:amidase [Bacilli bacterium]